MLNTQFHGENRERLGLSPGDYRPFGIQLDRALSATRGRRIGPIRDPSGLSIPGPVPRFSVTSFQYNPNAELIVPGSLTFGQNVRILVARRELAKGLRDGQTALQFKDIATGDGLTLPIETDAAQEATVLGTKTIVFNDAEINDNPPVDIQVATFLTDEVNGDNREAALLLDDASLAAYSRYGDGEIMTASQADPVSIDHANSNGRTLVDGDKIRIQGVTGMVELNGNDYYVDVIDANTFELYSDEALTTSVDGTGFTAFSSPAVGEFVFAHEVANPSFFVISWRLTY